MIFKAKKAYHTHIKGKVTKEINFYLCFALSSPVGKINYGEEIIMISLILGHKGSGKTKHLIECVNEAVENSNGNVAEIVAVITDFINVWLDENQEISLKELLNDYITIEGELADLKVGELLDKKLFSLDDLILNGALNELMQGTGTEGLLTALTLNDLYSILTLSASEDALDALDEINLSEVFALIEKINEQTNAE